MSETIPGPAYRLRTERLVLRCWDPADATLLNQAVQESQEHLQPWMPWARGELPSLQERISWLRRCRGEFDLDEDFIYGIFDPAERRVLGGSGLHTRLGAEAREIGYWIHKDFISRGFATETAAALTKAAFEIEKVNRVEIHCDPLNVRSAAVPRKLGYTLEAVLKQRVETEPGVWRDSMVWTLTASEYPSSHSASLKMEAQDAAGRLIFSR